ncbi:MAG: acetyltransferase, family, partial [Chthoniobacteraceae bacterium]|nr:acetyltransferase, family [Chthoniobacteraceae bacterium]
PGMPRESALFVGDEDPDTRHFGAFDSQKERLLGVVSIYRAALEERPDVPDTWQLRGMATMPEVRGLGFGKALVAACVEAVIQENGGLLWCNARKSAVAFYARQGWEILGDEFEIPTAGPHFKMLIRLRSRDGSHLFGLRETA